MILYHYTSEEHLPSILEAGLNRGDVPVTKEGAGLNAVWFTSDADPAEHGLGDAREMTDAERAEVFRLTGDLVVPGGRWQDKRRIRITVKIPSGDSALKRWIPWARKRLDPAWLGWLHKMGGGERKARSWYICFRVIQLSEFIAVERRRSDTGGWEPVVDA